MAPSHVHCQLVLENISGGFQAGDVGRDKVADEDLVSIEGRGLKNSDTRPGKHTKSYGKSPFIVSFPMKNGDFP
jgi:hypothetical protein